MKNSMEEFTSDYEETLDRLSSQITELFSEINYYQALVTEKDNQIIRLTTENSKLKMQIQDMSQPLNPPSYPSQQAPLPLTPPQQAPLPLNPPQQAPLPLNPPQQVPLPLNPPQQVPLPLTSPQQEQLPLTPPVDVRVNKRQCPECGAVGFAIREVDDKSRIISYVPRRIYAKKKSCTKCRYEWF